MATQSVALSHSLGKKIWLIVALLLSFMLFRIVTAMATKSATCDEYNHHIANGYSYLVTGDFRMNPASPPLPRMLAGLPLLFLQAKAPLDHSSWEKGDSPVFARQFFQVYNQDPEKLVFWARVPIVILSVFFGLAVFLVARTLFGDWAGLFSLIIYSFCPDILAHSGLATADLAVALFFFLTLWRFVVYLRQPNAKNLVWTGVVAGLAFLSKFSAILLFPMLFLLAFFGGKFSVLSIRRVVAFLLVCFAVVWSGYFFEIKPLLKNTPDPVKKAATYKKIGGEKLLYFAQEVPVPLSTFSSAFVSMMHTRSQGTRAYLLGHWSTQGWWYYYFVAFAIKNTIPFLILILLSFLFLRQIKIERLTLSLFLVPVVLFFAATLQDRAQAGIRYFLPIYPLFFIWCGATSAYLFSKNHIGKIVVVLLLSWHIAETSKIHPDYLAYFNELIGGPNQGYKYLRDSNLDWGQDLKGVWKYAKEEGLDEVVLVSLGTPNPGAPYRDLEPDEYTQPRNTVYAIGLHFLESVSWTADLKPTKVIGHSMFLYDFRREASS